MTGGWGGYSAREEAEDAKAARVVDFEVARAKLVSVFDAAVAAKDDRIRELEAEVASLRAKAKDLLDSMRSDSDNADGTRFGGGWGAQEEYALREAVEPKP